MDSSPFRILSICSGVGGIELGFKLAEPTARTVCYVEIEAFVCEILAKRMEEKRLDAAPIWTNIKTFDCQPWRGAVDCIAGGYPCQPFSIAGKRLGDKDPRHLWPDIKRIISEIEPPICFFENVAGHLQLGFEQVSSDLSAMDYKVKAGLFTAEEVGAPHKRERLFILAYSNSFGSHLQGRNAAALERKSAEKEDGRNKSAQTAEGCSSGGMAYHHSHGCVSNQSTTCGEDDQAGWKKCSKNSISCRNDLATARFPQQQAGFGKQKPEPSLSDTQEILADCDSFLLKRSEYKGDCGGESEASLESIGNGLCTNSNRPESYQSQNGSNSLPLWPPSPSDYEGWNRIQDNLKPAIHRMADGLADRVDRIRTCGNGVVPLVAAYAWRTLTNGMQLAKCDIPRNTSELTKNLNRVNEQLQSNFTN